jgi:ubiquinone/menaquinone biosynthesis C-methylase UbiE
MFIPVIPKTQGQDKALGPLANKGLAGALQSGSQAARVIFAGTMAVVLVGVLIGINWGGVGLGREASVSPGINNEWKSTDTAPLVARLEAETREIYRERAALAALVNPRAGSTVADLGAGSGFMTEELALRVGPRGSVVALDINPVLLEQIRQRAAAKGLTNIYTNLAREDKMNMRQNSVDMVFVCDTYHHFEYPESELQSIRRVLRAGGELVIVEFHRIPGQSAERILQHVRLDKQGVIREVSAAGFELVEDVQPAYLKDNYLLRFRNKKRQSGEGG